MGLRQAFVVARRVTWQIRRDRRTLALILVQPILIIGIFGLAFGGDVRGVRVAVANLDRGGLGESILDEMDLETVTLVLVPTAAHAEAAVVSGDVAMGIVIPANFTRNTEPPPVLEDPLARSTRTPEPALLVVYQDNTNPQLTGAAMEALGDALREAFEEETGGVVGFAFDERPVFGGEDPRVFDFFVPGVAAFAVFQLGSLLTVVTLVKERTQGTLGRVLATPARRNDLVAGYTVGYLALSVGQAVAILTVAMAVFGVRVQGSLLLALLVTTLVGFVSLGLGILVSGVAETEFQSVQAVFLISFPNLFLAGIFAPVESMPALLQPLSQVVPLTYAVDALRDIINHGRGVREIAGSLLALALFAVGSLVIAAIAFGRVKSVGSTH